MSTDSAMLSDDSRPAASSPNGYANGKNGTTAVEQLSDDEEMPLVRTANYKFIQHYLLPLFAFDTSSVSSDTHTPVLCATSSAEAQKSCIL